MRQSQDIWQEQCDAGQRVLENHGADSALDYLVGEKLMVYVATAEERPEFARELPKFVARVREIFGTEVLAGYVATLSEVYRDGERAAVEAIATGNDEDDGIVDRPEEWVTEARRLDRIRDLLTAERLGTG